MTEELKIFLPPASSCSEQTSFSIISKGRVIITTPGQETITLEPPVRGSVLSSMIGEVVRVVFIKDGLIFEPPAKKKPKTSQPFYRNLNSSKRNW